MRSRPCWTVEAGAADLRRLCCREPLRREPFEIRLNRCQVGSQAGDVELKLCQARSINLGKLDFQIDQGFEKGLFLSQTAGGDLADDEGKGDRGRITVIPPG
jgi:hypothetical protein